MAEQNGGHIDALKTVLSYVPINFLIFIKRYLFTFSHRRTVNLLVLMCCQDSNNIPTAYLQEIHTDSQRTVRVNVG